MNPIRFQGENPNVYYEFDKDSMPLGEGGMGRIYQGYRVDTAYNFQAVVAIKCIKPELCGNASIIQRAQREASVQIDHENLIRMYGFLSGAEYSNFSGGYVPTYFIAMERLIGVNLDDVFFNGITSEKSGIVIPLAEDLLNECAADRIKAAVDVMIPVLTGIQELHEHGYIHRDIDPSNVMLTQDGKVKVIDYGISKRIDMTGSGAGLTQAGQFLGKVAFAAPELIIGDLTSQGAPTDIYALGIMLFQLITGFLPVAGTDKEVMDAHLKGRMDFSAVTDKSVRKIIAKATSSNIKDRYQSCLEMIGDLKEWLTRMQDQSVAPVEVHEETDFPKWILPVSSVVGLAAGVVIGLFV